ncbi:dimethylamine methyltransferase [Candidatus Formimonas warabiya]|uniref:Dimethylamine methyltransferase n=1 Tax=Formimonas warabiya TaxID=1761012 RepID=A0A3G1KYV6_FORW1|nr:dimethylamine methyltransferase [Candidatus Formimonas warabiya]
MVFTRLGDGTMIEAEISEIRADLEAGTQDAAARAEIAPLSADDLARLCDIVCRPGKVVGVEKGNEIIMTGDSPSIGSVPRGFPVNRIQMLQTYERVCGMDTAEAGFIDYSYKAIKTVASEERSWVEQASHILTIPLFYGAMPDLGRYSRPDGPVPNWAELLPQGKIAQARAAQEEAIELCVEDLVYVASEMYEGGAQGIDFDTSGAAGDADFYAALKATEILKKKYPEMCIEMGMAGEFVLGMHSELRYDGVRLAGLYPHDQVKLAQKAGVTIFGPVVNNVCNKSFSYNLARAVTFCKACADASGIPVHPNVGLGVGGVTTVEVLPVDVVSRVSVAMAEVAKADGL